MKHDLIWCLVIFFIISKIPLYCDSGGFVDCTTYLGDRQTILAFDIGENIVSENTDDEMYSIDSSFYFVGKKHERLWWSTNGFVELTRKPLTHSFRCSLTNVSHPVYAQKLLVAPCCDDLKTKVSSVGERIFSRSSSNKYDFIHPTEYESISEYINEHYFSPIDPSFTVSITWFFSLTFDKVSSIHSSDPQSFQLILATDDARRMSFVIFQYPSNGLAGDPNIVGVIDGNRQNVLLRNHVSEGKNYPVSINRGSNIDMDGVYIFRVDSEVIGFHEPVTCLEKPDFLSCNRPHGYCNMTSMECVCLISSSGDGSYDSNIEYFGDSCRDTIMCYEVSAADTNEVCGGMGGKCVGWDNCTCPPGVSGPECQVFQCFGKDREDGDVCTSNQHGDCISNDLCNCTNLCFGGPQCNESACYGKVVSSIHENNEEQFRLLEIMDYFDGGGNPLYWQDSHRVSERVKKVHGGCGGDFGGYLFFTGNQSREILSNEFEKAQKVDVSFWFTQGRLAVDNTDHQQNFKQDERYPECLYELEEDHPYVDFQFDVILRIYLSDEESSVVFEEKLSKNSGQPYLHQRSVGPIPQRFRVGLSQSIPSDFYWEGRGGEWGLDTFSVLVTPSQDLTCSARGECEISTGECLCDDEVSSGPQCEFPVCFGLPAQTTKVCSGRGTCIAHDVCSCDDMSVNGYNSRLFRNCGGPSCFNVPSQSSLVCSNHGYCVENFLHSVTSSSSSSSSSSSQSPSLNNMCCCDYGFYGHECQSSEYVDHIFHPSCLHDNSNNFIVWNSDPHHRYHLVWEFVYSGEITVGNLKCGSISGQSLYFSSHKSSSEQSKKQKQRSMVSSWQPYAYQYYELSFWLVQGRGTPGCTYSGDPSYLEIALEIEYIFVSDPPSKHIELKVIKELDFAEYRQWEFVKIPFEVPVNSTAHRIVVRQNVFTVDSDEWSIDLVSIDHVEPPGPGFGDWWIIILFGLFSFAIIVAVMVISVVVVYAVYHRMKTVIRGWVHKKMGEFYELHEFDTCSDDEWSVGGTTTVSESSTVFGEDVEMKSISSFVREKRMEDEDDDDVIIPSSSETPNLLAVEKQQEMITYRPRLESDEMVIKERRDRNEDNNNNKKKEEEEEEEEEEQVYSPTDSTTSKSTDHNDDFKSVGEGGEERKFDHDNTKI